MCSLASALCMVQSLCNACGIRQRKARRAAPGAAAAAASASNGGAPQVASVAAQAKPAKEKIRADADQSLPFKKRCKMVAVDHAVTAAKAAAPTTVAAPTKQDQDHVSGDKVAAAATAVSMQSKVAAAPDPPAMSSFHAFAADEITDAAMLLMTLSCGLVRS